MTKYYVIDIDEVPQEANEEIRDLWANQCLGNNYCYYSWFEEMDETMPATAKYIEENLPEKDAKILLHFWW